MQCEAIVLELVSVGELVCVRLTMNGGGGVCVCANIGGYSIIHPHYSVWICVWHVILCTLFSIVINICLAILIHFAMEFLKF